MQIEELQQISLRLVDRFKMVEPRDWGVEGTLVELIGEVGSLAHCAMHYENYKAGDVPLSKIKDETSDVLFVIFKLAHVCQVELPAEIEPAPGAATMTGLTIQLSHDLGLIVAELEAAKTGNPKSSATRALEDHLVHMIGLLAQVAARAGFSLEEAHRAELHVADLWLDIQQSRKEHSFDLVPKIKFWMARPRAHLSRK